MEAATDIATTPSKHHQSVSPHAENLNPNVSRNNIPSLKHSKSPKPVTTVRSPQNRIRQRKFVVAKKNAKNPNPNYGDAKTASCKCKDKGHGAKCLCVAYENLRASQEDFFKNSEANKVCCGDVDEEEEAEGALIEASLMIEDLRIEEANEEERGRVDNNGEDNGDEGNGGSEGSSTVKRRRDKLLEEARNSVPESGSGRVMHLVKAFEKLLSMPKSKATKGEEEEGEEEEENEKEGHDHGNGENDCTKKKVSKVMKWALPGLQFEPPPPIAPDAEVSGSSSSLLSTSDLVLTSENLGLDSCVSVSSSWDSSRGSVSSRNSSGGRRSRRNSSESCGAFGGRRWKKKQQLKVTSQKPFKLRTEQRGKLKEEEFVKKLQEMAAEEQKLRVPVAQSLPWTTDEPECLVKPPVKESTRPIDLKLHSDVRAIDRAEFDHQVAEKMSLIEQLKFEREKQQKLEEEEEIRRLRKELIPKAQPMPYFDRPFVPRRSMKHPTIPREPKFHIPQHKKIKCCLSWNDMSPYSSYLN